MGTGDGTGRDGGWAASAEAWVRVVDEGDPSRELLLDPVMLDLCGDVRGARVLDAGCGEGRFSRLLGQRGASVVGLDPTRHLIELAGRRAAARFDAVRGTAERLPFADGRFDIVVSYVMLVDVPDFRAAIAEMARVLRPGGLLLASNVSFMSAGSGWVRDEQGRRIHYPVDRYFEERAQVAAWRGIAITNWHRPLGAYMDAFLRSDLVLCDFIEPFPATDALRDDPRFEDWYRAPNFTVMRWRKPPPGGTAA